MPTPFEWLKTYNDALRHRPKLLIGLMSGTSLDGVDAALVSLSGTGRGIEANLIAFHTHPFPTELRQDVLSLSHGQGNAELVSKTNVALAHLFADAAEEVRDRQISTKIDAVASHGQTISHTPLHFSTLQIGDPSVLAMRLGVPVVSHFRGADMALGGQGAPLIPYADWCLLTHVTKSRAVQNIGGIGNVTFLPADATSTEVLGFDTGPGNMLIDHAVVWATKGENNYDINGAIAVQGTVQTTLLERLLAHPFLSQTPPKSAGREQFGEAFFESVLYESGLTIARSDDFVATLTAFTAHSIAQSYQKFLPHLPDEIWLGGGGAHNPTLIHHLTYALPGIPVHQHLNKYDADAREAIAFALLAHETLQGVPSNLPTVTGASRPAVLGSITFP